MQCVPADMCVFVSTVCVTDGTVTTKLCANQPQNKCAKQYLKLTDPRIDKMSLILGWKIYHCDMSLGCTFH